jgi:hypothetical protein
VKSVKPNARIKRGDGRLGLAQLLGLLIDVHVLALEHDHPCPTQLLEGAQEVALGMSGILADAVQEARAKEAADSTPQTQGGGAFLLAGKN